MVEVREETKETLLELYKKTGVLLEGNILKVINSEGDDEFSLYIKECIEKDKERRRKRLEVTKKVQDQNKKLRQKERERRTAAVTNTARKAGQAFGKLRKRVGGKPARRPAG